MESLFYLRWDKGREAMAAQQRKDKFNLIPFFENGRNQLNYLSLCGRAAQPLIKKDKFYLFYWRLVGERTMKSFLLFLELVGYGRCQRQGLRQEEKTKKKWLNEWVSPQRKEVKSTKQRQAAIDEEWINGASVGWVDWTEPQGANSPAASPTNNSNQFFSRCARELMELFDW